MKKFPNMIDFNGDVYYFDLDNYMKAIELSDKRTENVSSEVKTTTDPNGQVITKEHFDYVTPIRRELDGVKEQILSGMVNVLLDTDMSDVDPKMGAEYALETASFGFKLSFNTLCHYEILKQVEE